MLKTESLKCPEPLISSIDRAVQVQWQYTLINQESKTVGEQECRIVQTWIIRTMKSMKTFIYTYRPGKQTLVLKIIRTTSLQKLREDLSGRVPRIENVGRSSLSFFLVRATLNALSGVVCESRLRCECYTVYRFNNCFETTRGICWM